jgi:hypothetical protein
MAPYIYKRNHEGIHIINLGKTWEKLMLAARMIAAIPNPKDVLVSAHLSALKLNVMLPACPSYWIGRSSLYRSCPTESTPRELY